MQINVTERHIRDGVPNQCVGCPVSLAIEDALGTRCDHSPAVRDIEIVLYRDGGRESVPVPPEVREFIANYDDGLAVGPFSFELPV